MAVYANLFIDQGTDFRSVISVESNTGGIYNIEEYQIYAQMRKTHSSTRSIDFTCSIYDAAQGLIEMTLTSEQTAGIRSGRYVYDVSMQSPLGDWYRVVEGQIEVAPRVTRPSDVINIDGGSATSAYGNYNVVLDGGPA